jgi:endonuclease YncB( thermonuclease family)
MNHFFTVSLIAVFLILQPVNAQAEKLYAKVIGVSDGDTITVLTPIKKEIKIRLAEIDAPEKRQPHGEASKKFLSTLVFGKDVTIVLEGIAMS